MLASSAVAAKSDIIEELMEGETAYWNALIDAKKLQSTLRSQSQVLATNFESLATSSGLLRHEIWAFNAAADERKAGAPEIKSFGKRGGRQCLRGIRKPFIFREDPGEADP